ncbi:MAG: hypothetical protein JWN89_722 [Parcubacteria group bacterium]|nr:hypothetical protein [Parcubacteria group bacterium]
MRLGVSAEFHAGVLHFTDLIQGEGRIHRSAHIVSEFFVVVFLEPYEPCFFFFIGQRFKLCTYGCVVRKP